MIEWRTAPSIPDLEISSEGEVRGYWDRVHNGRGCIRVQTTTPRSIHKYLTQQGYFQICVLHDGKYLKPFLHRLVLEAFVGPCPKNHEGCHRNGISTDNRIENLYWGTRKQNCRDTSRHGRNGNAKLSLEQVNELVRLYDEGVKQVELVAKFGINSASVSNLLNNRGRGRHGHRAYASSIEPKAVAQLIDSGLTAKEVAAKLGVSREHVSRLLRRHKATLA